MPNESDRVEPRQEADWKSMEFRRPNWVGRGDHGDHRFALGVGILLVVALVYPWYSSWVDYYLLTRGLEEATEQLKIESDRQGAAVSAQLERSRQAAQASQAQYAEQSQQDRVAGVRVMGVSTGGGMPLVLVNLGSSNLHEADAEICRQAAAWLRRDLSGVVLRIQRHQGARPAIDTGQLACH